MGGKTLAEPAPAAGQAAKDPWKQVMGLACRLHVEAPVAVFTVADLLGLGAGSVVRSSQKAGARALVQVNGQAIGQGEFDVVDDTLAIRLTELL